LKVNALTQRTGWVKVEVASDAKRGFTDCAPLVGDHPWTAVAWKDAKGLGIEPGQAVTLRFQLARAKLFGIEFD
jgi:hypothetical protein